MLQLLLHPEAVTELTAAADWYDARRSGLGADLLREADEAFVTLAENPSIGPRWPGVATSVDVRRLLLPRFPFGIAYLVEAEGVVVLAVAHAKRRPGYWIQRIGGD